MPSNVVQAKFTGGIKASYNDAKLPEGCYPLGINVRHRHDEIACITSPIAQEIPAGHIQHIAGMGEFILVFIDGSCWYKHIGADTNYTRLSGFQMSTAADRLYSCAVPSSTANYKRENASPLATTFTSEKVTASNPCLLVTDGTNQPFIIFSVGNSISARVTNNYSQWSKGTYDSQELKDTGNREYVPHTIKFPAWTGRRTIAVGADSSGNFTQILSSVSGRPLDFVINLTSDGDKGGNAWTTAHSVGAEPITGLFTSPILDDSYVVTTLRSAWLVSPDPQGVTLFGEPVPINTLLFNAGAVGPYAAVDLLGDTAFITQTGIQSFNAVQQLRIESNNLPLARDIYKYLRPLAQGGQQDGAAISFNDYSLFSVDTIFGPGIAVYDNTTEAFASIDLLKGVGKILQFTETVQSGSRRLWAYTDEDKFYELYPATSSARETARIYIGEWSAVDPSVVTAPKQLFTAFGKVDDSFNVRLTPFVDRKLGASTIKHVAHTPSAATSPSPIPYDISNQRKNYFVNAQVISPERGWATGWLIEWQSSAVLLAASGASFVESVTGSTVGSIEAADDRNVGAETSTFAFIADSNVDGQYQGRSAYRKMAYDIGKLGIKTVIGGGDHLYENNKSDAFAASFADGIWAANTNFYLALGNHDLDDGGEVFLSRFGGRRYYSYREGVVEFFILNGGWDTAHVGLSGSPRLPQAPNREPDGIGIDSVQMSWARAAIAASTAKFKVVVIHEPPYSNGSNYYPGYTVLRDPLNSLAADLFLHGHDHSYQRYKVGRKTFITAGTGGRDLVPILNAIVTPNMLASKADSFGWLKITANDFVLTTEFVGPDGQSFDKFAIYS